MVPSLAEGAVRGSGRGPRNVAAWVSLFSRGDMGYSPSVSLGCPASAWPLPQCRRKLDVWPLWRPGLGRRQARSGSLSRDGAKSLSPAPLWPMRARASNRRPADLGGLRSLWLRRSGDPDSPAPAAFHGRPVARGVLFDRCGAVVPFTKAVKDSLLGSALGSGTCGLSSGPVPRGDFEASALWLGPRLFCAQRKTTPL